MDLFFRAVIDTFFRVDISEVNYATCRYIIVNIQTHSILNYLKHHCLWRKKQSKVGPILSRKFQITYKIIFNGEKTVKIGTILSTKWSKDPFRLAMCNVYFRNELPTELLARFNAIQHKGDILPIRSCDDFYVSFVYRYCREQSICHIVPWIYRQSIISTIDNSTKFL